MACSIDRFSSHKPAWYINSKARICPCVVFCYVGHLANVFTIGSKRMTQMNCLNEVDIVMKKKRKHPLFRLNIVSTYPKRYIVKVRWSEKNKTSFFSCLWCFLSRITFVQAPNSLCEHSLRIFISDLMYCVVLCMLGCNLRCVVLFCFKLHLFLRYSLARLFNWIKKCR